MFVKFKDLEGIFKDLIPYQKRIKSLYRKIVELGYTGTEEEFVNFIYTEVTANLGKQDIKDKFKEIEDEIEKTIGNINKLGLNVLQKDNKTEYTPTENYNPATKKYVDDKIIEKVPRKLSEFENDLYYKKKISFLKLTKDDFVYDENLDMWICKQTPKLDWLLSEEDSDKLAFKLHYVYNNSQEINFLESNGIETQYFKENDIFEIYVWDDNREYYISSISFVNNGYYDNGNDGYVSENSFNIELYDDLSDELLTKLELELFKIEEKKIPKEVLDVKNADWNQNDETQIDYIKNRPFYESVEQVICIPEQTVNFAEGRRSAIIQYDNRIEDGYVCDVEFDGILYTNIVAYENMGDMSIYLNFTTESGHQISICDTASLSVPSELAGTSHTIKVVSYVKNLVKMDSKYLPSDLIIDKGITIGNRSSDGEIGYNSMSIGDENIASDWYCFALGSQTKAIGKFSYAEGLNVISRGSGSYPQHVQGKYNIEDTKNKYVHIVGNGSYSSRRSNAHTLDWDGNAWYQGNIYVGGISQDDGEKLATEKFTNSLITETLFKSVRDSMSLADTINGYNYIIQVQNGSLISFIKTKCIKIKALPLKLDYTDNDKFDISGLVVVAVGEDDSEREIQEYTYDKYVAPESTAHSIRYTENNITYETFVPVISKTLESSLIDFEYNKNSDGTYTITGWKGTLNGVVSTVMRIPNSNLIVV